MFRFFKLFLICSFLATSTIFAQNGQAISNLNELRGRKIPKSLLNRVSISLDNAPLELALADIVEKGQINLNYDRNLLPLHQKVSVHMDNVYAIEALIAVLQQTSIVLEITKSGDLAIIPAQKRNSKYKVQIRGVVIDSTSGNALPGANVIIKGTTLGAATNLKGEFILPRILPGTYTVSIRYIGYKTKEIKVRVIPKQIVNLVVKLNWAVVKGKAVEITAQASGQLSAINQQLSSKTIKNVVSAERLRENPDANVAEAIGRLPGISLIRSGGEGTGVVIRGLVPKYTQILLDGISLPSANNNTREAGISGFSQYALQGVEIFKSITPDMEGDAVAGAINLKLNEAPSGFKHSLVIQGGYNNLNNYWKNYRFAGDISNRFFNSKLGVIVNLNLESVNRSNQSLGAWYQTKTVPEPGKLAPLFVGGISLNDIKRINERKAGTLVIDYKLSPESQFFFNNFYSYSNQNYSNVIKAYDLNGGGINYYIMDAPNNYSDLYVGSLKAKHEFSLLKLDEGFAFTKSHVYTPDSRNWTFYYSGHGLKKYGDKETQSLPLNQILSLATDTLSAETLNKFYLYDMNDKANDLIEKHKDAYFNCKISFNMGHYISTYIKFGAKYKEISRYRNYDSKHAGITVIGDIPQFGEYATKDIPWASISSIGTLSMVGLYDHKVDNFLKNHYNFRWYPNINRLNQIFNWWNSFSNYYLYSNPQNIPSAFSGGKLGFYPNWYDTKTNTQKMNNKYYAFYIMSELNWRGRFVFVPGLRYEKVRDNLNGWWIETIPCPDLKRPSGHSTYSTHVDKYWMPNFHLKFKPTNWMQTLFSFTQTLKRPDYNMLIPNFYLNRGMGTQFYRSGNPDLKPEFWTNYDAQVALFGKKIGLVSVSGFYKKVKDKIWTPSIYRTPGHPWIFGAGRYFNDNSTVLITVPQNHSFPVYLKGLEYEMQTNLWFFPEPFTYISLNANFTLINSETKYRYSKTRLVQLGTDNRGRPIYKLVSIDSVYSGPMLNQPKSIANLSFGYNYKGFNLWLSYQYTGKIITREPNRIEFEQHKSKFSRWDLQISQKLPVKGLEALFNFANINNPIEYQNNLADPRPTYLENYGWTMDFGIRYRLY